jgi:uncharacterized protein
MKEANPMARGEESANRTGPLMEVVTWRVRDGRQSESEAWGHDIAAAALGFPGHQGVNVILPGGAERECMIIVRFDTREHLRAWHESDVRRDMLKKAEPLRDGAPSSRVQTGLEFWCAPTEAPTSPPRWKMALVTVVGVWPASMLVSWLLNSLAGGLPFYLRSLLVAVGIVALLTWVIMPMLSRLFRFWLVRSPRDA